MLSDETVPHDTKDLTLCEIYTDVLDIHLPCRQVYSIYLTHCKIYNISLTVCQIYT